MPAKKRIHTRPKLPTSSVLPRSPSPALPDTTRYFDILHHMSRETVIPPILGRPPNSEFIYPELVVPRTIIDHTPRFASRCAAFWQIDADQVPMTAQGLRQVQSSMIARMAIIRGHEEESCALLAVAQVNLNSTLQLQCVAAEDLELLCQENLFLQHIIAKLLPDSSDSPPPS